MNQAQLAKWLKAMTIIVGLVGLLFSVYFLPTIGHDLMHEYPELAFLYWPYLIWAWVTVLPCFIALVYFWRICHEISKDNSFCRANANSLQMISRLFLMDTILFFLISVVFFLSNMLHPGILLASFLIDIAGLSLSMIFAVLSHWVNKACDLKETNDLTI